MARFTKNHWSTEQARLYFTRLRRGFTLLAVNPEMGFGLDALVPNVRVFTLASHCMVYRTAGKKRIEIIRILHKNRDLQGFMSEWSRFYRPDENDFMT